MFLRGQMQIIEKMMPGAGFYDSRPRSGGNFPREIKINVKYLKKTLARILKDDIFDIVLPKVRKKRLINKTR